MVVVTRVLGYELGLAVNPNYESAFAFGSEIPEQIVDHNWPS